MVAERVFEINQHPAIPAKYPGILDEQILYQKGSFKRVRQYLRGWHPELGKLHMGWQGRETVVEKEAVAPAATFTVAEPVRTHTGLK